MVFIDWLRITQRHEEKLPALGKDLVTFKDIATGEISKEFITNFQHEGSHDSRIRIRSDGYTVEIDGNPSRWNRADNLFGYTSVEECVELYNEILESVGLPPFKDHPTIYASKALLQGRAGGICQTGPIIKRIDLTENLLLGNDAHRFIRGVAGQTLQNKTGYLYPNNRTADWYKGSRRLYMKYYDKAYQFWKFTLAKAIRSGSPDTQYLKDLHDWITEVGVVRHELSMKAQELVSQGLERPEFWTAEAMREKLDKYAVHNRAKITVSKYHEVGSALLALDLGLSERQARTHQLAVFGWLSGENMRGTLSKSSFYRMRRNLLQIGIDIANPAPVQQLAMTIRTLEVKPLTIDDLPDWYRRAA